MNAYCQTFRLYERGEAGICCDVDGVALGPVKLVERVEKSYFVRPVEDITLALEVAYGALPEADTEALALKIIGIARSLNKGELALAQLKTLYMRLPEIAPENFAKMGVVVMGGTCPKGVGELVARHLERVLVMAVKKANFNSDEPRDENGRWTTGGGAGEGVNQNNIEEILVTASNPNKMPKDAAVDEVYHGKKYSVSAKTAGNIIYNETRSFSGPKRDEAMSHIAHVILNRADAGMGIGGRLTSSPNVDAARVPKVEQKTYDAAQAAASKAIKDRTDNSIDPTGGAVYYNFRGNNSTAPWLGYENATQTGPFYNSYPTDGKNGHRKDDNNLPASGVYVNTYYNRQVVTPRK